MAHLANWTNTYGYFYKYFSSLDKYIVAILSNAAVLRDLVFSLDQFVLAALLHGTYFANLTNLKLPFLFLYMTGYQEHCPDAGAK